ncbi:OmpA family protein [Sandaracinus amylolyticus]|uniref:OmpA/MotB domain protein n=1 Tax=Sandaracinus amylolyticus TaxID=927083 RepID=A0A0F6VZ22_9BACT|nr:OmpA family protein [Sandaracinus amylolyticus]AKF03287.1 OmpA/MotB domain protein [Sandaracinus amylolyticus]
MRLSTSLALLSLLLFAPASALTPSVALAQEFDEFDEEFEEEEREEQRRQAPPPAEDESELEEDDLESDEFGEEGGEDVEAPPSDPPRATEPTGYRGRGGDLIRDRPSEEWRDRRIVLHNTWGGSVGGIHVVDAGSGPSETFRVQLLTDFFFADGFLNSGANHSHIGGSLSISWTPFDFIELYGSLASYANSTDNPAESPQLFQVLGDSVLGVKGYYEILPFLVVGGDVSAHLLNTVGDIGLVGESTSVGIRANLAADLRGLESPIPLIARLNLQYYFDNSEALVDDAEQARYNGLPTVGPDARLPYEDETRQLLTRFERYSLDINRTDFFDVAIGLEAPFTVMQDFTISPILEWVLRVPVNRQGYNCLYVPDPITGDPIAGDDGCLERQGFDAFPSTLTIGVRVMPPFRGLSITAAVDIGTTGMSTFVRELSGNAPYDVILGLGYAFDAMPRIQTVEREVERRIEVTTPPPARGRVIGSVVEAGTTTPVANATVTYVGRELTPQSTSADGRFVSYELEPGEVVVDLTHPEYNAGRCSATIAAEGGDVEVRCELQPLPRLGDVRGTLRSDTGTPVVGANVQVTGPQAFSVSSDASGGFARQGLPPGTYTARVDAEGYLITQETFEVRPRETAAPEITVIARPRRSLVDVRAREIIIRRQVNFATDSAEILPDSAPLLSEIADALLRNPAIRRVEIQGHTDSNGDDAHNMDLSQRRAEAVRTWLIGLGVEADRLTAQGYGETRPLVPNITAANRARNRRVQFIISDRAAE